MSRTRTIALLTFVAFALAALVLPSTALAAKQCKGQTRSACVASDQCSWVDAHERKNGAKVKGHCRAKPGAATKSKADAKRKKAKKDAEKNKKKKGAKKDEAKKKAKKDAKKKGKNAEKAKADSKGKKKAKKAKASKMKKSDSKKAKTSDKK